MTERTEEQILHVGGKRIIGRYVIRMSVISAQFAGNSTDVPAEQSCIFPLTFALMVKSVGKNALLW